MLVNERPFRPNWLVQLRAPAEKTLVATILIAFLILHVLAGAILQRSVSEDDASDVVRNRLID